MSRLFEPQRARILFWKKRRHKLETLQEEDMA